MGNVRPLSGGRAILLASLVLAWAVLAALAGCYGPEVPSAPASMTETSTTTQVPEQDPGQEGGPEIDLATESIFLTDCSGAMMSFQAPRQTWSGSLPEGWQDDETALSFVFGVECQRVSIGPFERPARIVWQDQRNPSQAGECGAGSIDQLNYLHAIVTDDDALANHLRETLQMPIEATAIDRALDQTSAINSQTWTFGQHGSSFLQVHNVTEPLEGSIFPVERLAWRNGLGGISFVEYNMTSDAGTVQAARATLQAPFIPGVATEVPGLTGGPSGTSTSPAPSTISATWAALSPLETCYAEVNCVR